MKTIVSLLLITLMTGCVRIGFERPVGTPVGQEELKKYEGEWLNSEGSPGSIALGDAPSQVKVTERKESGDEVSVYNVTEIDGVLYAWTKPDDLDAYLPGRVISSDPGYVVVLIPDEKEVKALVAAGKAKGRYLKDKDAWILSPEGMEEVLSGKEFWTLETALSLIRKPSATAETQTAPESAAKAEEASKPQGNQETTTLR